MTARIMLPLELQCVRELGRAFGGALLFNVPLLMTMEMWTFGFAMAPERLLAYAAFGMLLLYGLAHYAGFSHRRGVANNLFDTFTALAVGYITGLVLLMLFGVVDGRTPPSELAGHALLQAAPGAMGALLARRQMSQVLPGDDGDEDDASYPGELFLMAAGALFLALNLAPTEEILLIAYKVSADHLLALIALSIILLHTVVYLAGFAGQEDQGQPVAAFFHYTLPGYAIALGTSLLMLWAFGRGDGQSAAGLTSVAAVLGFPAALGAAAARLLV
jgi:putative integral membrane protein (TIGR02587 family)